MKHSATGALTSTPSKAVIRAFTFYFEESEVRSAVERAQRVARAVHPQTLVNPSGGYHGRCSSGYLPLIGRGGSDESSEPADAEHQSGDLSPVHGAPPAQGHRPGSTGWWSGRAAAK